MKREKHGVARYCAIVLALMIIVFAMSACDEQRKESNADVPSETQEVEPVKVPETATTEETTAEEPVPTPEVSEEAVAETTPEPQQNDPSAIRSDFKDAMDSYEAFIDEYVAFLEKYENNPSDLTLLASYASYMANYADLSAKFEAWESEGLTDAELAYYMQVQTRVSQKLLEVAQ